MSKVIGFALAAALIGLSIAAAQQGQQKKTAPAVKKGSVTASKKATAKKGAAKKSSATWRNRQMAPTPDRYREIQNALAARGFLSPDNATGAWGQSSVEGLKRFQAEQNLEPSGKINSLSLIALGLGPKRDPAPALPKPPNADQNPGQ